MDELHRDATVGDVTWSALAAEYTPEQLVELVVLVGYHHAVTFATNAFKLPLEAMAARFPSA